MRASKPTAPSARRTEVEGSGTTGTELPQHDFDPLLDRRMVGAVAGDKLLDHCSQRCGRALSVRDSHGDVLAPPFATAIEPDGQPDRLRFGSPKTCDRNRRRLVALQSAACTWDTA
jgi:hypothetical protein